MDNLAENPDCSALAKAGSAAYFRPIPTHSSFLHRTKGQAVTIVNTSKRAAVKAAETPAPRLTGSARKTQPRQKGTAAKLHPKQPAPARSRSVAESEAIGNPSPVLTANVRVLRVDAGIYTLHIDTSNQPHREVYGMTVPATHVGAPVINGASIEIVASYPQRGPWFGPEGGTAVINVPPGGGHIVLTAYGEPGKAAGVPEADLRRIDRPDPAGFSATSPGKAGQPAGTVREVPTEILLHIERAGDRVFPGRGWVGALGRKLRIEGFSIRPLEGLLPGDVEFKAFEPNGQETPWVTAGTLCGTRGRGLPLTGFAVRLAAHLHDRFEAVYQGSFFNAGIVGPNRNGEPCRPAGGNDPLEAINIRLVEKASPEAPDKPAER